MFTYSDDHKKYLKKEKDFHKKVKIMRFSIVFLLLLIWEILTFFGITNTFLYSSPSLIIKTTINLIKEGTLFNHISITIFEVLISFFITSAISLIIASIMWWNKLLSKVIDPFLMIFNSLPKVALGPLIIIWIGANIKSIIFMSITISVFTTIINLYQAFISTEYNYITLLKSFGASKKDILFKAIIPSNFNNIISTLKINMSLNFIGVIMGELLVSKKGLGYLITYGSQIFNINLVISSVFILGIISAIFYYLINYLEKYQLKKN